MPAGIRKQYRRYGGKMAEKNQPRKVGFLIWWSWRDLNPRPQALFGQIYMFSGLF